MSKALRLHHEQRAIKRQVSIAKQHNFEKIIPGRYRKQRAMDCGRSGCKICGNARHNWGYRTIPEMKVIEAFKYELDNL